MRKTVELLTITVVALLLPPPSSESTLCYRCAYGVSLLRKSGDIDQNDAELGRQNDESCFTNPKPTRNCPYGCVTHTGIMNGQSVIIRTCSKVGDATEGCRTPDTDEKICFCSTDLCNGNGNGNKSKSLQLLSQSMLTAVSLVMSVPVQYNWR